MALSVTQANQVNVLLEWLFDIDEHGMGPVSWNDARLAAASLAGAASKSLVAGLHERRVLELWDERNSVGALRKKRGALAGGRPGKKIRG